MSETRTLVEDVQALLEPLGYPVTLGPLLEVQAQSVPIVLGLTPQRLLDDLATGAILASVQIRIRTLAKGGNRLLWDAQDAVYDRMTNSTIPNVVVAWRNSSTPAMNDSSGRSEVFDTYYLRTDRLGQTG